jgi:hypothetical protein
MVNNQVTYGQLDKLLLQPGFIRQRVKSKWRRYEHAASDTVIILADKKPGDPARPSEVVSARIHLVAKGLISEEELERKLANGVAHQKSPAQ